MVAEVVPLFTEDWPDAVLRLAQKLARLREHPNPHERTKAQTDELWLVKTQLGYLIANPPA